MAAGLFHTAEYDGCAHIGGIGIAPDRVAEVARDHSGQAVSSPAGFPMVDDVAPPGENAVQR